MCHVPARDLASIYQLLSDGKVTLEIEFDSSVPEGERTAWKERLAKRMEQSAVEVRKGPAPDAAPVGIEVALAVEPGTTDQGLTFYAAVARATLRLHRASVETESLPGVSTDRGEAAGKALLDLVERVALALTW